MARDDEALVTVARFETAIEASLARGALQVIGIPSLVPGEDLGSFSSGRGAPWVVALQVFESDRERALVELRRMQIRIVEPSE